MFIVTIIILLRKLNKVIVEVHYLIKLFGAIAKKQIISAPQTTTRFSDLPLNAVPFVALGKIKDQLFLQF
jgi:hypothetical protein